MQRALTGQWVRAMEYDLVLPDGSRRQVIANAVPLLDDLGQPRGAVGSLMDLTELKQAQEALRRAHDELEERVRERTEILRITVGQLQEEIEVRRRAEAELTKQSELVQDLYNRAPCGYHSLDPEGWIVRINDTELDWLGYSREELVKRMHFEDLLAEESQPAFRENFRELLATGSVHDLEYTLKRKDGTVFPVLLNATVVTDKTGRFSPDPVHGLRYHRTPADGAEPAGIGRAAALSGQPASDRPGTGTQTPGRGTARRAGARPFDPETFPGGHRPATAAGAGRGAAPARGAAGVHQPRD